MPVLQGSFRRVVLVAAVALVLPACGGNEAAAPTPGRLEWATPVFVCTPVPDPVSRTLGEVSARAEVTNNTSSTVTAQSFDIRITPPSPMQPFTVLRGTVRNLEPGATQQVSFILERSPSTGPLGDALVASEGACSTRDMNDLPYQQPRNYHIWGDEGIVFWAPTD